MQYIKVFEHFQRELPSLLEKVLPSHIQCRFERARTILQFIRVRTKPQYEEVEIIVCVNPIQAFYEAGREIDKFAPAVQRLQDCFTLAILLQVGRYWPEATRFIVTAKGDHLEVKFFSNNQEAVIGKLTWEPMDGQ